MNILTNLKTFFSNKSDSLKLNCEKIIKRLGFKKDEQGSFVNKTLSGRTMIWLSEKGLKIKVYAHGYGETDFLPSPLEDKNRIVNFIRENEL